VSDIGCFSSRFHSAFPNHCQCRDFPSSIFLVCRAFRKDSLYVFLTQNRCIVTPGLGAHNRLLQGQAQWHKSHSTHILPRPLPRTRLPKRVRSQRNIQGIREYMRIIHSLEKLKTNGLTRLFVHTAWPKTWAGEGGNILLGQEGYEEGCKQD